MAALFSENLRIFNAENFKKTITNQDANTKLYLTIGRVYPWNNEAAPTQANTSIATLNQIWENMIGAKNITGNDIRHVIPRYNWVSNKIYNMYDDCLCSLILYSANNPFYIVNSEWNVYKCLSNGNGKISTVEPLQTLTDTAVEEADGYIWKFMYSISSEEQLRFTTDDFMPIKTLVTPDNSLQWTVQNQAINGSIDSIIVDNVGSNYFNANTISISIEGDGIDATAIARVNNATNTISSIITTNRGRNYSYATVSITDSTGLGSNARARAVFAPTGGHGSDPLRELGGSYLVLNVRLSGDENGKLLTLNDYRQIAILQDIQNFDGTKANGVSYNQTTTLTLTSGTTDYTLDEYVYQGPSFNAATFSAIVANWDSSNSVMNLTNVRGTPTISALTGVSSGTSRFIQSVIDPELKKYTGKLFYIDNIQPIYRSNDQTEDFKIILKF